MSLERGGEREGGRGGKGKRGGMVTRWVPKTPATKTEEKATRMRLAKENIFSDLYGWMDGYKGVFGFVRSLIVCGSSEKKKIS